MGGRKRTVEILAPAGSWESMAAAIKAGADAVYIGGSQFGARAYADNLDTDAMLAAIDYAHLRGRKLYLTVNTLLKQQEMGEPLYRYLKPYYEQGLDAVIVQDAGVLEFVSREFPGLAIHASTQMSLTMAEGAMNFEGRNVTRLVNARELGLDEIKRIRKDTDLEIESFVHGALCYCYSGQCLMSSLIGGRSGNRGRCAQPCRMEYGRNNSEPKNGRGKSSRKACYLLSPKDICTLDMMPQLIEAGIDSFKIEGRMKRYEYSAGVTQAYRREADRYLELGARRYAAYHREHPEVLGNAITELQDLYNRGGFTKGYYQVHNGREMMSEERPNHSGVLAAEVMAVKKNCAALLAREELHAQDVLEIRMQDGKVYEFTLKDGCKAMEALTANFTPGLPVQRGDQVFRTKNNALLQRISKEYGEKEAKILVDGCFTAIPGMPATLSVAMPAFAGMAAQGVSIVAKGELVQQAQKQPLTEEKIRSNLEKTGDTPFRFANLDIQIGEEIFLPVSKLNELRRNAIEQLETEIARKYRRDKLEDSCGRNLPLPGTERKRPPCPSKTEKGRKEISASVMAKEQLEAVLESPVVTRIYYDIAALPLEEAVFYAKKARQAGKKFLLRLPQICRAGTYDWMLSEKEAFVSEWMDGYLIRNYEELYLITVLWKTETAGKEKIADAMLYVMNREAKRFFYHAGLTGFTAPYEENQKELAELGLWDMELTVYGRLPLMTSAQCIKKNTAGCIKGEAKGQKPGISPRRDGSLDGPAVLLDRKKKELPVWNFCRFCYNTIYNPECLSLADFTGNVSSGADSLEEAGKLSPRAFRFDFTFESGQETISILNGGRHEGVSYTRGHFRRGVE